MQKYITEFKITRNYAKLCKYFAVFIGFGRIVLYLIDSHKVIRLRLALNERGRASSKGNRFSDPTPELLEIQKESANFEAIPKTSAIKRINTADHCNTAASHVCILNVSQMRRGGIT